MTIRCCECQQIVVPARPVTRLRNGRVRFVCRRCWERLEYGRFMHSMTSEDYEAIKAALG